MNISVISVGKLKEKFYKEAVNEYSKRISRFGKLEIIEIQDESIPDNASAKLTEQILKKEGAAIFSKLRQNTYIIALCIEGREFSSVDFSKKLAALSMQTGHITFIIGGSLGLCDEIKSKAQIKLSFGRFTLPHQLMRVVLLEQIYRAFKINANESYHK